MAMDKEHGNLISSEYIGHYELGKLAFTITNLLASCTSNEIFGKKLEYLDPICECLSRLLNRTVPAIIEREVIPGNPDTIDRIDIRKARFDEEYVRECLEYKSSNNVMSKLTDYTQTLWQLTKEEAIEVDNTLYDEEDIIVDGDPDDEN